VRGLSSLLILQELMRHINISARENRTAGHRDLSPHDVFNFVGGTSTGGLIALMLGKLGMPVEDCITQYRDLSTRIFRKKHIRGRITHGLNPSRYSGKRLRECVEDLLKAKGLSKEEPVVRSVGKDFMDW
jgi:patatin-like phospholipase/acyl hydrolase